MNINGKHGHGTHSTKIGADKLAQNTPNAPKLICPSPKVWDFDEKRLHWASVVRGVYDAGTTLGFLFKGAIINRLSDYLSDLFY